MIVYPQRKIKVMEKRVIIEQMSRMKRVSSAKRITIVDVRSDIRARWQKTIMTKDGYESFANFLAQELCVENLLFITEYEQLKDLILDDEELKAHVGDELDQKNRLTLPDEIPTGEIAEKFKEVRSSNTQNTEA